MMTRSLAVLALLAAAPALAEPTLAPAFEEARGVVRVSREAASGPARSQSSSSFLPPRCAVESWCLVKATECFLGQSTRPTGLWKSLSQYSVVRRVKALCPTGRYDAWESRVFMSPVEPVVFSSELETTQAVAEASALKLCRLYRADWVSAAPACPEG